MRRTLQLLVLLVALSWQFAQGSAYAGTAFDVRPAAAMTATTAMDCADRADGDEPCCAGCEQARLVCGGASGCLGSTMLEPRGLTWAIPIAVASAPVAPGCSTLVGRSAKPQTHPPTA